MRAHIWILVGIAGLLSAGGCAGGPRAVAAWSGTASAEVAGDWDDVQPAMLVAAKSGEVGLLEERGQRAEGDRDVTEWLFLTVRDEEMVARASRARPVAGANAGDAIVLEAAGGDEVVARRFVEAWRKRIAQLRGRAWAPK
jgi:hypothetical protein